MKKLRVFYLVVVFAILAVLVVMFSGIAQAGEVPDGFMGIPWGASGDQIIKTMKERGYQRTDNPQNTQPFAFRGAFAGAPCELNFHLTANSFHSVYAANCQWSPNPRVPQRYFQDMVKMLSEKYGPPQSRESTGDEAAHWHFIDSRTSDEYSISVWLYRLWNVAGTRSNFVDISYDADSLRERLKKKEKQDY